MVEKKGVGGHGKTKRRAPMLGAGFYPITIAELHSYSCDADRLFDRDEHEKLKEFLAFNPEGGDVIAGTGGVRLLRWPIKNPGNDAKRIVYYFRDLNMPLYLLALYRRGETHQIGFGIKTSDRAIS
jgi:hypothetical protein